MKTIKEETGYVMDLAKDIYWIFLTTLYLMLGIASFKSLGRGDKWVLGFILFCTILLIVSCVLMVERKI